MAKRKGGVNKSEEIRNLLTQNPAMSAKEVAETLAAKGVKVQNSLIYFVKGKMKAGKQRKARVMKAARSATGGGSVVDNGFVNDPITLIKDVRALSERAGGYEKLRELVDALAG